MASVPSIDTRRLRDARERSIKRQQLNPPRLPDGLTPDPVGQLASLLANGMTPAEAWPLLHTSGLQAFLATVGIGARPDLVRPGVVQQAARMIREGDSSAPQSAIHVHPTLEGLIAAARLTICRPEWVLQPWLARVICATPEEAQEIESLLRQDPEPERGEDMVEACYWIAENLHQPGAVLTRVSPVALADEVPEGAQLQEVFLSPGCRSLTAEQLLPAVRAARVGLHVAR